MCLNFLHQDCTLLAMRACFQELSTLGRGLQNEIFFVFIFIFICKGQQSLTHVTVPGKLYQTQEFGD